MRLRYMELPSEVVGDDVRTPFIVVFDKCDDVETFRQGGVIDVIKDATGARGVLAFLVEVELDA